MIVMGLYAYIYCVSQMYVCMYVWCMPYANSLYSLLGDKESSSLLDSKCFANFVCKHTNIAARMQAVCPIRKLCFFRCFYSPLDLYNNMCWDIAWHDDSMLSSWVSASP